MQSRDQSIPAGQNLNDHFDIDRKPIGNTSSQLFLFASPLATTAPLIQHFDSKEYLHTIPTIGGTQLTTVLENGSRYFITSKKKGNEEKQNSMRAIGNLLSMPMTQLSKEADKLQREILTAKKKSIIIDIQTPLLANEV